MRQLYVVTHTEASHHRDGLVGGWYDSELTARGHEQAAAVAERLRTMIPADEPVELYSSDLKRAYQTAEAIARRFDMAIEATPDLREKSYGEAGGKPQAWLDARFIFPPATGNRMDHQEGIAGAETRREIATRVYRAVDRILSRPYPHQIIVTHGFALTFVVAAWIGMPLEAAGLIGIKSTSGGITHLVQDDRYHNRGIASLNDVMHLR